MDVSKTALTILFVIIAVLCGALVSTVALFSGVMVYESSYVPNIPLDAPPNIEALRHAVKWGFIMYLFGLIPLERVSYRTVGFKRTFALFFVVPITVYWFWASIGATLSFYILWAIAAMASYQALVICARREH